MLFSKHALLKIEEREIGKSLIEKVIEKPDFLFYDIITKSMVAIGKVEMARTETYLVIPFVKEGEQIKVVTIYPCKNIEKEINKKEAKRWIKIR
ncbi:MAG: DUF4258 domain-containing protein [bacterium]